MENRPKLSRRDFMKAASVIAGSALVVACTSDETVVENSTSTLGPTETLAPTDTAQPIVEKTPKIITLESRFQLGSYDAANDPFEMVAAEKLRRLLDHFFDLKVVYEGKLPFPSTTGPALLDRDKYQEFYDARKDNSGGNPIMVIPVDLPNNPNNVTKHLILYTHARQANVPGELSRELFVWLNKNPDRQDELYSQSVDFILDGNSIKAQIVNVTHVSKTYWEGLEEVSPWREYPMEKVVFAKSELLGIPKEITENLAEDEYLITVVGCLPIEPFIEVKAKNKNDETRAYALNGFNRVLATYKLKIKP